jgi:hypothetical protein
VTETSEITLEKARAALDLEIGANDSGASTVRGYLTALLTELWREEEGFSGGRPFGNSGWQYDIYKPLVAAGLVTGALDEDGYPDSVNDREADALVLAAIAELGAQPARVSPDLSCKQCGAGGPYAESARDALDAQTLHDSPGADL